MIIGSGIASLGFTVDAQAHIRSADKVFFCVADAATVGWIRSERPDAYDLYVLYDDAKPRYHTYVQMTEAMLHFVRQGLNVVAIFYGHPGIFVLSTHRAIRIARREGYRAVMKPGISALDCLCADLSVDPAQPGLQTLEATDMLIRRRRLDPGLHVIIWQVGLIGELGYRRKGFLNDKFPLFVEYLRRAYGPDHPVTHYVAARYATMEPLVATHTVAGLLDHKVRSTFTGLSTLYLPPRDRAPVDLEMAIALGLAKPGDVAKESGPLREIDRYGSREMRAVAEFGRFRLPPDYQYQGWTGACEFLIDLARDIGLQRRYASDPEGALAGYPRLSARERSMLATRNEGALQLAAKGTVVTDSPAEALVHEALSHVGLARSLAVAAVRRRALGSDAPIRRWQRDTGRDVDWRRLPAAVDNVLASSLRAWTGIYLDPASRSVLTVVGNRRGNKASTVYLDGHRVPAFTFANRVLAWEPGDGCASGGELLFGHDGPLRLASGTIRTGDAGASVRLQEPAARGAAVAAWLGRYVVDGGRGPTIDISMDQDGLLLAIDGKPIARPETGDGALRWEDGWLAVARSGDGTARLTGFLPGAESTEPADSAGQALTGELAADFVTPFLGQYRAWRSSSAGARQLSMTIAPESVVVGADDPQPFTFGFPVLEWPGNGSGGTTGDLRLYVDPVTWRPSFSGTVAWPGSPAEPVHGTGAGGIVPPVTWIGRHVGSDPLPVWAATQLAELSEQWTDAGGLHLHAQWRKTYAAHALLREAANKLQDR